MKEKLKNISLLVLILLPVLCLNLAHSLLQNRDIEWQKIEQQDKANSKLEEVAANLEFESQFTQLSGQLKKSFATIFGDKRFENSEKEICLKEVKEVFKEPFPEFEAWIFSADKNNVTNIAEFGRDISKKRSMAMVFNHLLSICEEHEVKPYEKSRGKKLLAEIFGSGTVDNLLAFERRGAATPIIYKAQPCLLFWDYGSSFPGEHFGLFIIIPGTTNLYQDSLNLSAAMSKTGKDYPGGFLRIYKSAQPDLLKPAKLENYQPFSVWRKNLGLWEDNSEKWEKSGFPWNERVGEFRAFTRILPGWKHIAFTLLPEITPPQKPWWLFIINVYTVFLAFSLIFKGLLMNDWPMKTIKSRFMAIFLISITLPVSLLATASTIYIFDRFRTDENQLKEKLQIAFSKFEASKEQLEAEYVEQFRKTADSEQLKEALSTYGLTRPDIIGNIVKNQFLQSSSKLSVSMISLYAMSGNFVWKTFDRQKDFAASNFANIFRMPLNLNLRELINENEPELPLPDFNPTDENKTVFQAYRMNDSSIDKEIERYRGRAFKLDVDGGETVFIHNYISLNGKVRYALMISYDDSMIDRKVLLGVQNRLGLEDPEIKMAAFKKSISGFSFFVPPDRSVNKNLLMLFEQRAKIAATKPGTFCRFTNDEISLIAATSKNFRNLILVAGLDHFQINRAHFTRVAFFSFIGLVSIFLSILGAYITYKRTVSPLKDIRIALEKISLGNLNIDMETRRKDEIGQLSGEFSNMVSGLKERERLAAILSDQAVEAISSQSVLENSLGGLTLSGVVMISDIRSFTTMCETNDPSEITGLLNTHFASMACEIVDCGGRIYKFIGDAIEAVFLDDPQYSETAEDRAIKASVAMLKRLETINQNRKVAGKFPYAIGVGLSRGLIVAGSIGSAGTRLDYAMLGKVFKTAEKLEASTKGRNGMPLITDFKPGHLLEAQGIFFTEVAEDNSTLYILTNCHNETVTSNEPSSPVAAKMPEIPTNIAKKGSILEKIEARKLSKVFVFLLGAFCSSLPFLSFLEAKYLEKKITQQNTLEEVKRKTKSFLKNISGKNTGQRMLEQLIHNYAFQLIQSLPFNINGNSREEFQNVSSNFYEALLQEKLKPDLFVVAHKPSDLGAFDIASNWKLAFSRGAGELNEKYEELLQGLAITPYFPDWITLSKLEKNFLMLTGKILSGGRFYHEAMGVFVASNWQGKESLTMWLPLYKWNPNAKPDLKEEMGCSELGRAPPKSAYIQTGEFLIIFPFKILEKIIPELILKTATIEQLKVRILDEKGQEILCSSKFPTQENSEYGWDIQEAIVKTNQNKFRVFVAKDYVAESWSGLFIKTMICCTLWLGCLFIWFQTIFREKFISLKFSQQLWVGLLAAAILPICGVFLVNEQYAVEQKKLSISQERFKLNGYLERLERRQSLHEIPYWDSIEEISKNSSILKQAAKMDKNPSKESLDDLAKALKNIIADYVKKETINFKELQVNNSYGWQVAVYPREEVEASSFQSFIRNFISEMFKDLKSRTSGESQKLGTDVKDELKREGTLNVMRSLFGADNYFKIVNGLDTPIRIFFGTGFAYLKFIPSPSMTKPENIFFWVSTDTLNRRYREITEFQESQYAIIADRSIAYGAMCRPTISKWFPGVIDYARTVSIEKRDIQDQVKLFGKNYLVEARLGKLNEIVTTVALAAADPIFQAIENRRKSFLALLLLSVLAIIILAIATSWDLTGAIHDLTDATKMVQEQMLDFRLTESRHDEVGDIYSSFNSMIRGLKEKEFMGTMVSRFARQATANEENAKIAEKGVRLEVAVMYIAAHDFSSFVSTFSSNELIDELSQQTIELCRIISANDGDIDKIMGEKLLAVFYSPDAIETSVKNALKTIEEIQKSERFGNLKFPVTIGLHCGEVIAGLLGVGKQRDFTIIGDPVNTAARIASKAGELQRNRSLVSQKIKEIAKETDTKFSPYGQVELKGKSEQVNLFSAKFH